MRCRDIFNINMKFRSALILLISLLNELTDQESR